MKNRHVLSPTRLDLLCGWVLLSIAGFGRELGEKPCSVLHAMPLF